MSKFCSTLCCFQLFSYSGDGKKSRQLSGREWVEKEQADRGHTTFVVWYWWYPHHMWWKARASGWSTLLWVAQIHHLKGNTSCFCYGRQNLVGRRVYRFGNLNSLLQNQQQHLGEKLPKQTNMWAWGLYRFPSAPHSHFIWAFITNKKTQLCSEKISGRAGNLWVQKWA